VIASWLPPRAALADDCVPRVLLAVAFRDEAASLPDLLDAIDDLDYPPDRLRIALIDDASADASDSLARVWAAWNPNATLLTIRANVGKAEALNRALQSADGYEIFAVFDADVRPRRDCLRKLAAAFADPRVAAVGGYTKPVVAPRNIVSAYAALEAWTHQLVNLAAKDRLDLNPPVGGGNCAYRRDALVRAGGFPRGTFSEDTAVSLAMANNGGTLRFVRDAICEHRTTDSLRFFWNQRQRWSSGMASVVGQASGLESVLVGLGYADRFVMLVVAALALAGSIGPVWLAVIAAPAAAAIGSALAKGRPRAAELRTLAIGFPFMAAIDVGVSVFASVTHMIGNRPVWASRHKEVAGQNE